MERKLNSINSDIQTYQERMPGWLGKDKAINGLDLISTTRTEPRKLYFAYGMNTNLKQMSMRCPDSKFIGRGVLEGSKLVFKSVADWEYSPQHMLHGAVWLISKKDEDALDKLEGYPSLYDKQIVEAKIVQSRITPYKNMKGDFKMMIYKMTSQKWSLIPPSENYWKCLLQGYKKARLPKKQLVNAQYQARLEFEKINIIKQKVSNAFSNDGWVNSQAYVYDYTRYADDKFVD